MTSESILSPGGVVTVADRVFHVSKLSFQQEISLGQALSKGAKTEFGPGGYFAKSAGVMEYLKQNNRLAELQAVVNRLTELEATGVMPSQEAVEQFRQSPKGVALELFWRTRKTHGDVTQAEIASIVTEVNALEVYLQVMEAITDEKKAVTPLALPSS